MMAGLVDTSVHIQDPGRGDWEGFASVTKAAGVYFHYSESSNRTDKLEKQCTQIRQIHFDLQNVFSAAGGITTLIDMPIHSKPPITSTDSLFKKVSAANGKVCFAIDDIMM